MLPSLAVRLTVLCSGTNAEGKPFEERTRTSAVDKSGGLLVSRHKLQPGATLELCLLARPDRRIAAVVSDEGKDGADGIEYGFHFADPAPDFWGIRFPDEEAHGQEGAVGGTAGSGLADITDQLVVLAAHADDHLRYVNQEMEVLRQRFERELQAALEAGARQLRQLARSTMETTFRSLLEDLARRAAETVDENLNRLRKSADESLAQFGRSLGEEAETRLDAIHERLDKNARQALAQIEKLKADAEHALAGAVERALGDFQDGCTAMIKDLLHSTEAHRIRTAAARKK